MIRRVLLLGVVVVSAMLWTCVPAGTPSLSLKAIELATGARIEISATNGDGTIGKGAVSLTASAGTLESASVTLDEYGSAAVMLDCNPSVDSACLTARVIAKWTPKDAKEPLEEQVRLSFPNGTGVDGGTGGGAGGGGGGNPFGFDGGLRLIEMECGTGVPGVNPTCCRTSQEFGKQQPKCPAVQMQPGATFPVNFDGYRDDFATMPFELNRRIDLTFTAPTNIAMLAQCPEAATATLTANFNNDSRPVSAVVVYGRVSGMLWVGEYAGAGGAAPPATFCSDNAGYPLRLAYYVTMNSLAFKAADGTLWKQSSTAEWYFYTVALGAF